MEYFKKYGRGRYLNGLSIQNPQLYRWWYREMKTDETPLYGNKLRKDAVQVSIEDIEEETYEMPEVHDYDIKNTITKALLTLTPREERVIRERFFNNKTLVEIGQTLNVSDERIRQIIAKSMRKMKHPSKANILKDVA